MKAKSPVEADSRSAEPEGGRCAECGTMAFPVPPICSACLSQAIERCRLPESGTLYTFTVVHHGNSDPITVGYVDLPAGVRVFGRLEVGVQATIGLPVRVVVGDVESRMCLFVAEENQSCEQ